MKILSAIATLIGVVFFGWAFIRLFNIDPQPIIINIGNIVSGGKLIDIDEVFVPTSNEGYRVCSVDRVDTDGDGFREWLVFYQYDKIDPKNWRQPCPDNSSRLGAIYDNDRGTPSIVFPYSLKPPTRDILGEQGTYYELAEIVANQTTLTSQPIEELLVYGRRGGVTNQLTIFKYQQNTQPWELPTDDPPRYKVLGAFQGNGGVEFDSQTKQVTIYDRGPFERSQLAIMNVYALRGEAGQETYMSDHDMNRLAAPIKSTIDFTFGPPEDILYSEFPEKIVLAFYESLDSSRSDQIDANSRDFLAPSRPAYENFDSTNLGYFFGKGPSDPVNSSQVNNLSITKLDYFPLVESVTSIGTQQGEIPQRGRVDIEVVGPQLPQVSASYEVIFEAGRWLISRRLQ